MKIYLIWLIRCIAWNFAVPNATPIEDVIVAITFIIFKYWSKKL